MGNHSKPITFAFLAKLKGSWGEHGLKPQEVLFFSSWEAKVAEFRAHG